MAYPSRPLRRVPPGSTWEITLRTLQSRLLIIPTSTCRDRVLGILGRALERHPGVKLHSFVFLTNHFHLLLTVKDGAALADFMCFLNSNLARKIAKLFGWQGRFWSRRYRAIEVVDEASMVDRLFYCLSQGVKEGLVSSPRLWPGASAFPALAFGTPLVGTWIDETSRFRSKRRGDKVGPRDFTRRIRVHLSPIPCWSELSEKERRRKVREMVRRIESDAPRRVVGVQKLLRKTPGELPETTSRSPAPPCHAATKERWQAYKDKYRAERDLYVSLARQARRGDLKALRRLPRYFFPPRITRRLVRAALR